MGYMVIAIIVMFISNIALLAFFVCGKKREKAVWVVTTATVLASILCALGLYYHYEVYANDTNYHEVQSITENN
ncbi:MAG: hypothetical protein HFJ17_00400 [Clostridia bacterium]|nr:hypothetical protein [Clostridia bacterium]